ncbi:MAG: bifunctional folylpolyglutamate synthase/dihydrofolate synthase [Acidimicrobiales bacterium mtb01]|nr:bifunctional folylpolyglutamate synthase/dihydrofolate synthase [Actinomycetota bacterium]TEX44955.1 MAG: bifunctional folylpolyglutamate synthase/dihydrofolate synthase [Acidimicrobiales bacterium mtb01]
MDYQQALAYLDEHATYEKTGRIESPSLATIERLCAAMGDPQHCAPVIHITGTNGKGSTAQMITRLLVASGLRVGTYISPHLERVNERMMIDGVPISDHEFGEQVGAIADLEIIAGVRPGYFDTCTAAAFRWFADQAVDAMVIEVGLLGRWDATNVVDAQVAVITNIGLDHMEFAGPTRAHIAREKSGIVKSASAVVTGETDPEMIEIFRSAGGSLLLVRDTDFAVDANELALGGRLVVVRTPTTIYPDVFVPLHGRHQADNAAVAITAVETFFARPLADDVIAEAMAKVSMPGRFELLDHQPLVIVDGAHNPAGGDVCASVFFEDFDPAGRRILVVGCLRGREPIEMLEALRADEFDVVVCCTAPSPRGRPATELAEAARAVGCDDVRVAATVEAAIDEARREAGADDAILVTGSLYVVGAARPHVLGR